MSFSIQTNINSLIAQENLRVNSDFQSRTIQRLTSGFRINQSGDDAAGLAIANKFRSDVAELTQGVRNANDGISTLQIVDGGMNNISKMLDRLKTLATQSASGTFTGDRSVLNNEFSTLLSEIDRQSQAIGMDAGGTLAKSLSVFIGGGRAHGTNQVSTQNGSVTVDLASSAVDTRSLGLKGMQAVAGSVDIGSASATSVANILADTGNTTATSGYSDFHFSGPGFSGGDRVKVSVNLQGVTDVDSMATAINAAIQSAGNGVSQAATAMKNANIVASVHTDANGGKQLAFTSSTTAFQVQAGDRMANALMGNLSGTTGVAVSSAVAGAASAAAGTAFTPANVTVRIAGGGLAEAVDLTFASGSTTTGAAITDLAAKVAGNAALQAAGITVSGNAGEALTFTSARGEQLSVMVTGDTAGRLGFGSFVAGSGGAADYATIQGVAYDNSAAHGSAKLEFSLNGAVSNGNGLTVNLNAGDATAAKATGTMAGTIADQTGNTLTLTVDGGAERTVNFLTTTTIAMAAAQINTQASAGSWGVSASVDADGHLVLTSATTGAASSVEITGGTARAAIGLAVADNTGTSRTAASVASALNDAFATTAAFQNAGLRATVTGAGSDQITIASSNGTSFRATAGGSGAAADIGFGTAGASFSTLSVGAAAASAINSQGATHTGALSFTALSYGGSDQAVTISTIDPNGAMQSATVTLRNDATGRSGRSLDEAISHINQQLQQTNNPTLQKIVAVKTNDGGTEKINFVSSLKSFSVSVGSSANAQGIGGGTAQTFASGAHGSGANVSIDSQAGATSAVSALADAVRTLGTAQAAVGKAQNQLGYALTLAQSQISNYSGAESRIRDADIASEAANLTKAQVLQQASLAAMAQANSAPQAVLALLRG
jgi:flagellin